MALTKKSKFKYWVAPFGFRNHFHAGGCLPAYRRGDRVAKRLMTGISECESAAPR
jgi:hypothetical protein